MHSFPKWIQKTVRILLAGGSSSVHEKADCTTAALVTGVWIGENNSQCWQNGTLMTRGWALVLWHLVTSVWFFNNSEHVIVRKHCFNLSVCLILWAKQSPCEKTMCITSPECVFWQTQVTYCMCSLIAHITQKLIILRSWNNWLINQVAFFISSTDCLVNKMFKGLNYLNDQFTIT